MCSACVTCVCMMVSYADSMGVLQLRKNVVIILWWVGVRYGWSVGGSG